MTQEEVHALAEKEVSGDRKKSYTQLCIDMHEEAIREGPGREPAANLAHVLKRFAPLGANIADDANEYRDRLEKHTVALLEHTKALRTMTWVLIVLGILTMTVDIFMKK